MREWCCRRIVCVMMSVAACATVCRADTPGRVDFDRDIRPVLSDRCFVCHGPDSERREADLRLDQEQPARRRVIAPGKPEESELFKRLVATDPDERMPPPDSKLALQPAEIERIKRWIDQGAHWDGHWAFVPPVARAVPTVSQATWPGSEIDQFVLERMERNQWQPLPAASRETLIRRWSFDLTGLPPTVAEIDAFLADTGDGADERVVDRLLASDRYGERMAADWLDLSRYSDTYGYQVDRDRFVWPWRDWVIRAFNRNLPYDQFVTEQLAGDLLPGATDDQVLATTFNRLHPQKVEGGSVPEEFRVEYVADRCQTFTTGMLGLTFECARCHDHKYDPLTQKEYYQLFAFFNNIDEAGLYSYFTNSIPTPTLLLTDDAKRNHLAELDAAIHEAESAINSIVKRKRTAFESWLKSGARLPVVDANDAARASAAADSANASGPDSVPGRVAYLDFETTPIGGNARVPGHIGHAVKLTGDDAVGLDVGNFRRDQPFSVALWINTPDEKERAVVFHRSRAWTDAASRGYEMLIEDGRISAALIHFWPGNAIGIRMRDRLPVAEWHHVAVTYDGSSRAAGLKLYLDGQESPCDVVRDKLTKNITGGGGDNIAIGERFRDRGFTGGIIDEFQVFDRELTSPEIGWIAGGPSLPEVIARVAARATNPQRAVSAADTGRATSANSANVDGREGLFRWYLARVDGESQDALVNLAAKRQERSAAGDAIQEIMVMRELEPRRPTFVLKRGAYDAPGQPVDPETPSVLPPFPVDQPRDRLGLARWLTQPNHPLTARVTVNRFWQMVFGRGLVTTPEDFGSQGSRPTHPELLDWLAVDFVNHNWDVKRLLKQLVLSATYGQSSNAGADRLAQDPDNQLLARGPRYRLSAEMLRDNALFVSGLLVERIGGPPARPYEVESSFKPVTRDKGEGLYRRSLYTYWKRTGPAPAMMALDAAKRDVCQVRRERTSSPLQALVLLNDPQYVETSRVLAQRLIKQHGDDTAAILDVMFRMLTSRRPSEQEAGIIADLYRRQVDYFEADAGRSEPFLKTGDAVVDPELPASRVAALGIVANTLLSFDDCMIRQ